MGLPTPRLCPFVIALLPSVFGISPRPPLCEVLNFTLGAWLCLPTSQQSGLKPFPAARAWTSSASGTCEPGFQSKDRFPRWKLQKANMQSTSECPEPRVAGGASLATLPPTAQPCQTVSNLASPAQPFSHMRRGKSRREGCSQGLIHISPGN